MNKKKTWQDYMEFVENNTIEADISYRGGTLKIDVSSLFDTGEEEAIMGAYQNYLGGGIAGAIQTGRMFDVERLSKKDRATYELVAEACKRYFYELNNGGGDEYMQENVTGSEAGGYEATQGLPTTIQFYPS